MELPTTGNIFADLVIAVAMTVLGFFVKRGHTKRRAARAKKSDGPEEKTI